MAFISGMSIDYRRRCPCFKKFDFQIKTATNFRIKENDHRHSSFEKIIPYRRHQILLVLEKNPACVKKSNYPVKIIENKFC